MFVSDLRKVAKSKMSSKFTKSSKDIHDAMNKVVNRKNKFQENMELKANPNYGKLLAI
jgi:hypothetical protein